MLSNDEKVDMTNLDLSGFSLLAMGNRPESRKNRPVSSYSNLYKKKKEKTEKMFVKGKTRNSNKKIESSNTKVKSRLKDLKIQESTLNDRFDSV